MTSSIASGVIGGLGSVGGSFLASSGLDKPSRTQKKNKRTIDDILAGLNGEGPFADIFSGDFDSFQKSFVDPAKAVFQNQIAPQIQQSFISSGLQRGTGLDDTLTRSGVDLDQMLNSSFMDYLNNVQNRREGGIKSVLGADVGGQKVSKTDRFNQALGGFLQSEQGNQLGNNIFDKGSNFANSFSGGSRPGFAGGIS